MKDSAPPTFAEPASSATTASTTTTAPPIRSLALPTSMISSPRYPVLIKQPDQRMSNTSTATALGTILNNSSTATDSLLNSASAAAAAVGSGEDGAGGGGGGGGGGVFTSTSPIMSAGTPGPSATLIDSPKTPPRRLNVSQGTTEGEKVEVGKIQNHGLINCLCQS